MTVEDIQVTEGAFGQLSDREGFMPATYLARYKWIWMNDINRLSKKEWESYISMAYHLVASRLPGRVKKQIGL